jgi:Fe-Mn family superoxide dismutase
MQIHHGKHHQAYVTNLNAALYKFPELHDKTLDVLLADLNAVPESIRGAVRNNGGGHWNHSMFWQIMSPSGGSPSGDLAAAINSAFGNVDAMKQAVNTAGTTRFGPGWAWLVSDKAGKLSVESSANQDNPLMEGRRAVLGVDVWEHAYYLHYQNRRPDYLAAWWNVVNWAAVASNYEAAKK